METQMTDSAGSAKLVQYLSEAYGKERELETALTAHIGITTRKPYKKRLQTHLTETKGHARSLERRINQIGDGGPQLIEKIAGATAKALALAKGPLHVVRGTGEAEKMLKNAKTEYSNEHEEIATYSAIEALAESLGDSETAKLAREIRRDEERMAGFLAKQIPILTRAVVAEEVPASERAGRSGRRGRSRKTASRTKRAAGKTGSRSRSDAAKATSSS
jgi:ferritin-like metal-binding protein YciE